MMIRNDDRSLFSFNIDLVLQYESFILFFLYIDIYVYMIKKKKRRRENRKARKPKAACISDVCFRVLCLCVFLRE